MTILVHNKEQKKEFSEISQERSPEVLAQQEQESQPDIQSASGEVSDFMGGLDVPTLSEKVSERVAEDDKKQKGTKSKTVKSDDSDDDFYFSATGKLIIPPQRVMVRRIRRELHKEIKTLLKQAKKEEKKGAFYLNEVLVKVRELREILASLATATFEVVKNLYITLFSKSRNN